MRQCWFQTLSQCIVSFKISQFFLSVTLKGVPQDEIQFSDFRDLKKWNTTLLK